MDRRSFISTSIHTSVGSILIASSPFLFATNSWPTPRKILRHSKATISSGLSRRQWKTIITVQEHLFPSEDNAPGAREINAKAFLYAVLSDAQRDDSDRKLVKDGLISLQDICWETYKQTFIELKHEFRENALRSFEKTPNGTPWIMTILGYIFEALLTDPVYGGNPESIGWQWLEHKPGFPRPTSDKRYFQL
ncbi:MAG: gluconate 2-dehydrogenase subunit 3 family protein [Gammaproteobacteria bacterium]|nr:gluconate 2-dehydrogenase subunit 3 family protein [Gammaproteobacteria bacterium]